MLASATLAEPTLAELRAATYKERDSWWTVLLVDPVAVRLVRLAIRLRWATPNRITGLAFLLGLAAAGCFLAAGPLGLVAGAVIYHLAFVLDCVDGKLARWQRSGSIIGGWLDFTLDQIRLVTCVIALLGGQYRVTDQGRYLLLAVVVVFLDMFRYFNGFLIDRALLELRAQSSPTAGANGGGANGVDRLRDWLTARRIRLNVYSGIEFQMVVLIVAPLAGAMLGAILMVTIAACVLMVAAELAQTARFLRTANRLRRGHAEVESPARRPYPVEPVEPVESAQSWP